MTHQEIKIAVIGNYPVCFQDYFDSIKSIAYENNIELIIDRPSEEISCLLNDAKVTFLPFPDGCSERRGSYLAALTNGCIIITTQGKYTTDTMLKTAFFVNSQKPMHIVYEDIINMTEAAYLNYQNDVESFLKSEFASSWNEIAEKYNQI
jgi:glycosyltransferase involved in cell wall biosynthesis